MKIVNQSVFLAQRNRVVDQTTANDSHDALNLLWSVKYFLAVRTECLEDGRVANLHFGAWSASSLHLSGIDHNVDVLVAQYHPQRSSFIDLGILSSLIGILRSTSILHHLVGSISLGRRIVTATDSLLESPQNI